MEGGGWRGEGGGVKRVVRKGGEKGVVEEGGGRVKRGV